MNKGILISVIAFSLVLLGCSSLSDITGSLSPSTPKIVRTAQLASKWEMRHINLDIAAGEAVPVLLKLADGDKVDGYFYLEKGNNIDFQITANSLVYRPSTPSTGGAKGITSDRFSFTATQAQGSSYTLTFRNAANIIDKQASVTIFLEVIYPSTGTIFTLLESK